jgi:hypothetical protein
MLISASLHSEKCTLTCMNDLKFRTIDYVGEVTRCAKNDNNRFSGGLLPIYVKYTVTDRDPAAGSSRIDDRDTTPINDDTCCNPCLLAVHRPQVPRRIT